MLCTVCSLVLYFHACSTWPGKLSNGHTACAHANLTSRGLATMKKYCSSCLVLQMEPQLCSKLGAIDDATWATSSSLCARQLQLSKNALFCTQRHAHYCSLHSCVVMSLPAVPHVLSQYAAHCAPYRSRGCTLEVQGNVCMLVQDF